VTREMAAASRRHTISHFLFSQRIFTKSTMVIVPHPTYSPDWPSATFFCFPN
jgi:hypothetical protein